MLFGLLKSEAEKQEEAHQARIAVEEEMRNFPNASTNNIKKWFEERHQEKITSKVDIQKAIDEEIEQLLKVKSDLKSIKHYMEYCDLVVYGVSVIGVDEFNLYCPQNFVIQRECDGRLTLVKN